CWPHQSRPKWFDVAYIDRIIAGYVEEGNQPAADWYRRLKEKRLLAEQWEAERLTPAVPHRQTEGD
ncbi:hypothetical protein JYU09_01715, partial [bacterium AH-315-O15]|nr:hypothetical protein [bacterium AH-315-O15]